MKILPTNNQDWGFWGTTLSSTESLEKTQKAWNDAFKLIIQIAGFTPLETVEFLDSRWGRHMADDFYSELQDGSFAKAFKNKMTKESLKKSYLYYVEDKR